MPDQVQRVEPIWMFGKRYDFNVYGVFDNHGIHVDLDPVQYKRDGGGAPWQRQKNQIVLHFTAGNGPASGTIDWWNMLAQRANYYCPQWDTGAHHHFRSPNAGLCPAGHGRLKPCWASAHYVVELGLDRLNPGGQTYSDVIEVVPSDYVTFHGEAVNQYSIGIEHANVGTEWSAARHGLDAMTGAGANQRPTDRNRYLHLPNPNALGGPNSNLGNIPEDFQAYQDEQYAAMILLLRHLCIHHRIPRRFLGDTTQEKMQRWWHNVPDLYRSKLMRFRGILSHMNCHANKECGGPAMHRNRLFRGIIDEWWLPVQIDGTERPYYMGPFDPQMDMPSYFRWTPAGLQSDLFHDADLDALQETKSYFNLEHVQWYYAQTESPSVGGIFPIGTNRVWHGGVHFEPPAANPKVYATASGTIVAARLGGDTPTENDPQWGSQRFVLIRHCIYIEREANPGGGERLNYQVDPKYVFTLYMHLAPFGNLQAPDRNNPPWFNKWVRAGLVAQATGGAAPPGDPNTVFCPNVEIAVGDWLGQCGAYRGHNILHFEVMSKNEITVDPWDRIDYRVEDKSGSAICTVPTLDQFVRGRAGDGIDTLDILRAAPDLRGVKCYHKSEWALENADALLPVLPKPVAPYRIRMWEKLKHFMWVADAVAQCPDLSTQLCDATGFMWSYHPITFMEFANRLVLEENGQISEPDLSATNVSLENGYLTQYIHFAGGAALPQHADGDRVKPFDVSTPNKGGAPDFFQYHFTRAELACLGPGPHDPPPTPPQRTRFHLSLLDVLENIWVEYGNPITVTCSHLCNGHRDSKPANLSLCVLGTSYALENHSFGHAVDIRPAAPTPLLCRKLWTAAVAAASALHSTCDAHGGEPSRGDLFGSYGLVRFLRVLTKPDAVQQKLETGHPLTAAEAAACILHLEVIEQQSSVVWECWIRRATRATAVRIDTPSIIGAFNSQQDAEAERETPQVAVSQKAGNWECAIRRFSVATQVRLQGGGIMGVFSSAANAEAEKESGSDSAWPKEQP
jgi:hypothetical protein